MDPPPKCRAAGLASCPWLVPSSLPADNAPPRSLLRGLKLCGWPVRVPGRNGRVEKETGHLTGSSTPRDFPHCSLHVLLSSSAGHGRLGLADCQLALTCPRAVVDCWQHVCSQQGLGPLISLTCPLSVSNVNTPSGVRSLSKTKAALILSC